MTHHFSMYSLFITIPFLVMLSVFSTVSFSFADEAHANLPENSISITFDLAQSMVTGTSKIILPPDSPLKLFCDDLEVTGAILEINGKASLTLKPTEQNIILIPSASSEQTVFVSWNLAAAGINDNLISDAGITLAGLWHPLPDIDMTYRLEAKLPDGFTAISEGETVAYGLDKFGNRYLTTAFDHPIRSIHFAAGPYTVKTRTLPEDIILSAFFFNEDLALADEYLDKAEYYLELYQDMIGPYPFNRYSIVENRLPTGYGMPTYTLLGQAVVRLPFIKDTSLGHEILHSWFGNSVLTKHTGGNWSEGLATYLADQYYTELNGMGAISRKEQLLRYASYVPANNEVTLENFNNPSHSQPMARQVRAVGYDKSSMVFHMLRRQLGDDLFFRGLKDFYLKNRFTRAGWDAIEDSFTSVSEQDLSVFFDQWLTRWDIPKIDIDFIDVTQVDGRSKISFTLRQKTILPYSFQLPVTVKTRNAEVHKTLTITEQSQDIAIEVDALPVEMIIDPEYDLMRTLRSPEIPPIWSRFIGAVNKTVVLPSSESDKSVYKPLIAMLERMDCEMIPADELDNEDLSEGSFLFLGNSRHSLGLFADPAHSKKGVTIDVRENPLAPGQLAVLVTSPDETQTRGIVRKLNHYGKYSFLYFENGPIVEKSTTVSDLGIHIKLFTSPEAIRVPDIRSFDDIVEEIKDSKVVYIGEMHTDLGSHVLQLQTIQALFEDDPNLAIGMEMFPRSAQETLDQYINGTIVTEKEFLKKSDYFGVWGYDYRYYRDIIGYAHRNKIPLIGLNIDKAIVSQVFKDGNIDGLDEKQTGAIPPERKLDTPGYQQRLSTAFSSHSQRGMNTENIGGFIQAQSIWDETMAESIIDYLDAHPERKMVVIAGNGHVYKDSAIPPRVSRRLNVPQSVISSIHFEATGLETGYNVDYLVYTQAVELEAAPKVGVVLESEEINGDPENTRLRIIQISPHGKALKSGLKEKDLLLALDGQEIREISDIKIILLDKRPGDKVTLKVLRERMVFDNEELDIEVELSSPLQFGGMPPSHPK